MPPLADRFPPDVDVELIDVGRPLTTNLAVEDVGPNRPTSVTASR